MGLSKINKNIYNYVKSGYKCIKDQISGTSYRLLDITTIE